MSEESKRHKLLSIIEEARTTSAKEIGLTRGTVKYVLSEKQYEVLKLVFGSGDSMTHADMAIRLGISISTFYTHKKRGIVKLSMWVEEKKRRAED